MAALAIPIVVLGSLYILSEQEKKNEGFTNEVVTEQQEEELQKEGFSNYNPRKIIDLNQKNNNYINSYTNPNQHTDKYYDNTNNHNNTNTNTNINLLSGQNINQNQFQHNNMKPFFGGKLKGITKDFNDTQSLLDSKQGNGSQLFNKIEQAPLFKPDENVNLPNGTANNSDFFQSRMNESMKMSNVTLWEQQKVAPGLNLGYGTQNKEGFNNGGTQGSHGFNSGMMSRESWMPKNVDDLRVETNPKNSFDLNGHHGPANSYIKSQGPNNKIGKIEKHLPEKHYESGPTRWFTTTGIEKNPTIRSDLIMPTENRIDTTREYYGAGGNSLQTYNNSEYQDSKRQDLGQIPWTNASLTSKNTPNQNDHNINSYNILPNNRVTDKQSHEFGGVYGIAKSVISPLLDILNPTRKETTIENSRQNGNINGLSATGHLFNKHDITKTTNREITTGKINMNHLNVQGQQFTGDAYKISNQQIHGNQRGTTNKQYIGNAASNTGIKTYDAAYKQQNNVNKTYELHPNQGNMSLFNNYSNIEINRNENIMENNRSNIMNGGPNVIQSSQFMGEMNGIQTYDNNFNNARMDQSLLNAFKNNPYTQSLNSVA